jgi:beta-lactamase class A
MRLLASAVVLLATTAAPAAASPRPDTAALAARGEAIAKRVGGSVAFSVLHLETGQATSVNGGQPLPLYSVFKLPVAIAVLREAEAGRVSLEKKIHIEPKEALLGGSKENDDRWARPVDATVRELIGWSIVHSDNTSVDALLELLGGPAAVMKTMKELGFPGIVVKSSIRTMRAARDEPHANVASADDLARLLAALHHGKLLKEKQRDLVLGFMYDAVTGLARIRGNLPKGTKVADKTGTGPHTSNDVGIVTLPDGRGHLAIAALVTDSKRSLDAQNEAIAEFARAAYDTYAQSLR